MVRSEHVRTFVDSTQSYAAMRIKRHLGIKVLFLSSLQSALITQSQCQLPADSWPSPLCKESVLFPYFPTPDSTLCHSVCYSASVAYHYHTTTPHKVSHWKIDPQTWMKWSTFEIYPIVTLVETWLLGFIFLETALPKIDQSSTILNSTKFSRKSI